MLLSLSSHDIVCSYHDRDCSSTEALCPRVTGREERGAEGFMNLQGPHGEELGCGEFVVIRELQAVTNYSPSLNPKARVYQWITKG